MQREITRPCRIFEENGEVMNAGWARRPVFEYNSEASKTSGRHSERDCYFVNSDEVSLYLSVENLGSYFAVKIAVADLKRGGVICDTSIRRLSLIKTELPESDDKGELLYNDKRMQLQLTNTPQGRYLKCDFIDFAGIKNLYFNLFLKKLDGDSLNELAPFERNRKYFYYKRFMPKFTASGVIRVGGLEYNLNETNGRGYFDMTRFSKPRKHDYQRLSADCMLGGERFSLCLATRVGDNRYGNENCFFLGGKIHKLSQIKVNGSPGRLERPVYFKAGTSAVDITFKPFTVRGKAMTADMDKTTVVFGRLFGSINRVERKSPIVLDNAQAHLIFTEF